MKMVGGTLTDTKTLLGFNVSAEVSPTELSSTLLKNNLVFFMEVN